MLKYYKFVLMETKELIYTMSDSDNALQNFSDHFILLLTGFFRSELSITQITLEEYSTLIIE
jgi:hypothetical protein